MPLRYRIHETGIIITTKFGRVTPDEVSAHLTNLRTDPQILRPMRQLIDNRGVTDMPIFFLDSLQLASQVLTGLPRESRSRICFLVDDPNVYAAARHMQGLLAGTSVVVEVFDEVDAALAWIGLPLNALDQQ